MSALATSAFFSSIPPTPPRPTLFPYTTLFRSGRRHLCGHQGVRSPILARPALRSARHRSSRHLGRAGDGRNRVHHCPLRRDRKSTRLNSSHTVTSYAVFCLKKKTSHTPAPLPR